MSWRWPLLLLMVVAACGGGGGESTPPDAPVADAAVPDAEPPLDRRRYVIDSIVVPTDHSTSDELSFDLDGDGVHDNRLGTLLIAFEQAGAGVDLDPQPTLTKAIDRGTIVWLAGTNGCEGSTCFATYAGANAVPTPCASPDDATCRRHLDGSGHFEVDEHIQIHGNASGMYVDHAFEGSSGTILMPFAFAGGTPFWVELVAAHVHAPLEGTGLDAGYLGGAIPKLTIDDEVVPSFHYAFATAIDRDCSLVWSDCTCTEGSFGATARTIFTSETDDDCLLTLQECRDNSVVQALFRPDIDVDGDGLRDALSVGVGFTAVAATFEP